MRYHSVGFLKVENLRFTWTGYGDDVIDHFREKYIVFRDTRDHQEHDAKNRLLISGPSFEKPVAEIDQLKKKPTLGHTKKAMNLISLLMTLNGQV